MPRNSRKVKRLTKWSDPSASLLETLPHDIVSRIANNFLSPKDRLALSSCSRQLRRILPMPLVINIANEDGSISIKNRFFVTPWRNEYLNADKEDCYCQGDMLHSYQTLHYGQEYVFWNFDYSSDSPMYLGRHARHDYRGAVSPERLSQFATKDDKTAHCFTIALRQGTPMQTWKTLGNSSLVSPGDPVVWEDAVGLMVSGKNPTAPVCHQDFMEHSVLSCFPDDPEHSYPNWMVLRPWTEWQIGEFCECVEWGLLEKLRLSSYNRICDRERTNPKMNAQSLMMAPTPAACQTGCRFVYCPGNDIEETHAIGNNDVVQFHLWIDCGIMYFLATNMLFSIAVPIVTEDGGNFTGQIGFSWGACAIQSLIDSNSRRWDIIERYMDVASDGLDVEEYCPDKDAMMRQFKEFHRDYTVEYRESSQAIHVDLKGGIVCTQLDDGTRAPLSPSCREKLPTWKFVITKVMG